MGRNYKGNGKKNYSQKRDYSEKRDTKPVAKRNFREEYNSETPVIDEILQFRGRFCTSHYRK